MRRTFQFFSKTTIYFYFLPLIFFPFFALVAEKEDSLAVYNGIVVTIVLIGVIVYGAIYDEDQIGYAIFLSILLVICLAVTLFSLGESISKIKKYRKSKMADNISVNEVGSYSKADYFRFTQGFLMNQYSAEVLSYDIEYDTEDEKIYETKEYFSAIPFVNAADEIKNEISVWVVCDKNGCGKSVGFSGVGKVEDFYSSLQPTDPYYLAVNKAMSSFGLLTSKSAVLVKDMPKDFNLKTEIRKAWKSMVRFPLGALFFWVFLGLYPIYIAAIKFLFRKIKR